MHRNAYFLHRSLCFLDGSLLQQSNFEHLLCAGDAASYPHVELFGNPVELDGTMLANAAHDHRLAPIRLVDDFHVIT
jgi:hypothetical protein